MSIAQFDEYCEYLGIPEDSIRAKAFDVSGVTIRRWREAGNVPGPVRALLRTQRLVFNAGLLVEFSNGVWVQPLHGGMHGDMIAAMASPPDA